MSATTPQAPTPFLWICGPSGVGKSSVGWAVFSHVRAAGIKAAYVDSDQIGFCLPAPADDPDHYHLRARNLRAMWPHFRGAGATCLIVSGILETHAAVRLFTEAVPATILTICRLRANPETLKARILLRGRGCGPQLPGDQDLSGASPERLMALLHESLEAAALLERNGIGNLCVDTTGRSLKEIAQRILATADGWSALLEHPHD